ncbi:MAG: phage tail protein, partial [Devosia sp.]
SSSVFSYTDNDILITREQGFDPYPVLEETHNAIRATYFEPAAGWAVKDAPARYSPELEAEDMGRQLAIDVRYETVFSGTQVQRLMKAAIEEARRFRRHGHVLPPEASELEPLDVVSWTSAHNGYTAKKFIITEMEDEPTCLAPVQLQEIDPADHDFDPDVDELPWSVGELTTSRPVPQEVSDWAAAPYAHLDAAGGARRPGIKFFWDGDQPDVRALLYQVRLAETEDVVLSGEFATTFSKGSGVTPAGSLLSNEAYETRGRYDPISDRATAWSEWTPVTTPNLPDADLPPIVPAMLGPELAAGFGLMIGSGPGSLAELMERWDDQLDNVAGAVTTANMTANVIRQKLEARFGDAIAAIFTEQKVRASATEALASQIDQVVSTLGDQLAGGLFRLEGTVAPDGASSTIQAKAFARIGGTLSQATWMVRAEVKLDGSTQAFMGVLGALHVFATPDGEPIPIFTADPVTGVVTMSVADIGEVRSGLIRDAADTFRFDLDNMRIYRTDGTFDIDAKNGRIRIRKPA